MAGRPSKFTAANRQKVLEALQVGASRRVASAVAGIGSATLARWVEKGRSSPADSPWARFLAEVEEAEAHPKMRALGVIYQAMPDRPELAWKFIERRVDGFEPPVANAVVPVQPVTIQLTLHDGSLPALGEVIEGEIVEPDSLPDPASLPAAADPASTAS